MYRLKRTICEAELLCSLLSPRIRLTKMPRASWIKGLNKTRTVLDSAWNTTRLGEANQYITASKSFKFWCWMRVRLTMANIASMKGISGLGRQHECEGHTKAIYKTKRPRGLLSATRQRPSRLSAAP